jgi:hypothetical protein
MPPVSEAPSDVPTEFPSAPPSMMPSAVPSYVPTLNPSDAPSGQPSIALEFVDETVGLLLISYPNVPLLNDSEIGQLETLTEVWFEEFYNEGGFDNNQNGTSSNQTKSTAVPRRFLRLMDRLLPESSVIRNMTTNISVQSQNLSSDGLSNTVSYNQQLMYRILPGSNESANTIAIAPFRNVPANKEYQARLRSDIAAFKNVGDIEPPKLEPTPLPTAPTPVATTTPPTAPTPSKSTEKKTLTSGAIAGIAVGGLIVLALVGYAFIILPNELKASRPAPVEPTDDVPAYSTEVAKDAPATDFEAQGLAPPATAAAGGGAAGEIAAATGAGVAVGAAGMAVGTAAFRKHNDEETSTLGGFSDKDDGNSYAGKRYVGDSWKSFI